ncbi:protein phosphatase 1 regulatory subunit 16A-like, partial [Pollicipes pollicipes]|uniref:protein phosphatase 1 regulatory subunit 16A-like n=1 Tax=Pollicipes pollicipes TaxID=41117 RepID=UPI001884DF9F
MVARAAVMEHDELVREMTLVEQLTTQERLKLARKRRKEQLRLFLAREKEWTSKRRKSEENRGQRRRQLDGRIHFVDGVVLLEAAARNDVEEVRRLLESGVDPDSTNEDGLTALHQCCIDDSEAMMAVLLDHGANVNAEDSERWTPLHAAATCGHLHLVRHLVERGANHAGARQNGNEARLAASSGSSGLRQRPPDRLEERVQQHATPLHVAAANGYLSVVEFLLESQVSVGPRDRDDWQPIHAAACWGHPRVVELLYEHGADLTAKTKNGETAFDVCEDPEIRERLEQLRTEQELRRSTDAQLARVRRTQSTKHSIRRTSMRQKTLTPKKDVKEEARIRLGVEGSLQSALGDSNRSLDSGLLDLQDITIQIPDRLGGNRTAENGGVTVSDGKTNGHQVNNNDQPPSDGKKRSLDSGSSLDSSKIDIHVHVTVNTGGPERPPPYSAEPPPPPPGVDEVGYRVDFRTRSVPESGECVRVAGSLQ